MSDIKQRIDWGIEHSGASIAGILRDCRAEIERLERQLEAAEIALNEIRSMVINSPRDFEMRDIAKAYFARKPQ